MTYYISAILGFDPSGSLTLMKNCSWQFFHTACISSSGFYQVSIQKKPQHFRTGAFLVLKPGNDLLYLRHPWLRPFGLASARENSLPENFSHACIIRLDFQSSNTRKTPTVHTMGVSLVLKPGNDLLSHGETPHYHRRYIFSLLSSIWDQVVQMLYGHQTNWSDFTAYKDSVIPLSLMSLCCSCYCSHSHVLHKENK